MVLLFDIHCVPFEPMLICFLYCLPYNEIALQSIWIKDSDRILFDFVFSPRWKRRFEIVTKRVMKAHGIKWGEIEMAKYFQDRELISSAPKLSSFHVDC